MVLYVPFKPCCLGELCQFTNHGLELKGFDNLLYCWTQPRGLGFAGCMLALRRDAIKWCNHLFTVCSVGPIAALFLIPRETKFSSYHRCLFPNVALIYGLLLLHISASSHEATCHESDLSYHASPDVDLFNVVLHGFGTS